MRRDPATDTINFYQLARDWLHTYLPIVRRASPNTIQAYRIALESFIGFLADHDHLSREEISFDQFDRAHIKAWIAWMDKTKTYAPRTVTLRLAAMKTLLAYAAAEDITIAALHQQAATLKTPAITRTPIEYLDPDQTRAILAANTGRTAKSRRNRMLLIMLYETAARVGELATLTLGDINPDHPGRASLHGKRNKTRLVPLTDATIAHLRIYLDEFHPAAEDTARPLFFSLHQGQPSALSTDAIAAILTAAATTARNRDPSIPDRVHPHMLRKTKAMDLYQEGIPLPIIMRLLGHENISTTNAFYAFATIDMMRQAIQTATPTPSPTTPLTQETITMLTSLR